MHYILRIDTWGEDMSNNLGQLMDKLDRIMREKDFIFYELSYKPSEYCIEVIANNELMDFISDLVPEGWNYKYEYLGKYQDNEDLED